MKDVQFYANRYFSEFGLRIRAASIAANKAQRVVDEKTTRNNIQRLLTKYVTTDKNYPILRQTALELGDVDEAFAFLCAYDEGYCDARNNSLVEHVSEDGLEDDAWLNVEL